MDVSRKILLVEDDNLLRRLVSERLEHQNFEVASAANASDALELATEFDPDIALLDVDLGPGPNGIDLAEKLSSNQPGIALVFLTNIPEPRVLSQENNRIPKNAAYLHKDRIIDSAVVNQAIEAAISERMPNAFRDDKQAKNTLSKLSRAQISVAKQVALGLTNVQIAKERGTTVRSVELLLNRILTTLGYTQEDAGQNTRVFITREYVKVAGMPHNKQPLND